MRNRVTVQTLREMKRDGKPIVGVTAVDFLTAALLDECGVDFILVGDSLAMSFKGEPSTVGCRLDEVLYHTRIVSKAAGRALIVSDMPAFSYHKDIPSAITNAAILIQDGGAGAVKIEGGRNFAAVVKALVRANIPVMGHLGITPQSELITGGYRLRGKTGEDATRLLGDARALVDAGVFAIVLECVPWKVSRLITANVPVPTIGVGSGVHTDGQGLVHSDLLGMRSGLGRYPKFAKQYSDLTSIMRGAFSRFVLEVQSRTFPTPDHHYELAPEVDIDFELLVDATPGKGNGNRNGTQVLRRKTDGLCLEPFSVGSSSSKNGHRG